MNRIYSVQMDFSVIILAFVLMDTHVHFILYGEFDECNKFIHEYVRRTSMALSVSHGKRKSLSEIRITHQHIETESYLKTAICYVLKNPTVGGLHYCYYDYPWSSGALMFRKPGYWTSPEWTSFETQKLIRDVKVKEIPRVLKSHSSYSGNDALLDQIVFPGSYVAYEIAEKVFRTHKSFMYFMGRTKESDVESQAEILSHLSVPIQEMRQYKYEVCMELFGQGTIKMLGISKRIELARTLKSRYKCSTKQLARLCGLVYDEVRDIL